MAPLDPHFLKFTKLFLYCLLASSFFVLVSSHYQQQQHSHKSILLSRRNLLEKTQLFDDEYPSLLSTKKTKSPSSSSKNQTTLIKTPSSSSSSSKKNQTKLTSTTSTKNVGAPSSTKLNLNSTKSLDPLLKPHSSSKNKTKPSSTVNKQKTQTQKPPPTWMSLFQNDDNSNDDQDYDLISEIRDLPTKFHQSFVPDIHILSKMYITKANNEITKNLVKPYVGHHYASSVSTAISCAFIIVPFLLVSLILNQITSYFSIQRLIIFVQVYLSIYFTILSISALITGLEPLRFFYATSQSTYVWLQVLQTLGYVMYLLMLLMYLILVFSTESGLGLKFLTLAQTFVAFAVGLHYYITVFHRVVLHQPPKTNWKVHGIYATCFLLICLLSRAESRKKAYLEEGGEEGKQS